MLGSEPIPLSCWLQIWDSAKDTRQTILKESCLERGGKKTSPPSSPPSFRQGSMTEYRMAHSIDYPCGARVFHRVSENAISISVHETTRGAVFLSAAESLSRLQILPSDDSLLLSSVDGQCWPIINSRYSVLTRSISHIRGRPRTDLSVPVSHTGSPSRFVRRAGKGIQ